MGLAYTIEGDPFDVPQGVVGWRVKRSPRRGHPVPIPGPDGTPLVVPVNVEADVLAEILGELGQDEAGRYRLDAVDEHGRNVANVPQAYWELVNGNGGGDGAANLQEALASALQSNEKICKTMADAMKAIATQYAAAMEASARAAGLRAQLPADAAATSDDDDDKPTHNVDWTPLIEAAAPVLSKVGELAAMKGIAALTAPKPTPINGVKPS